MKENRVFEVKGRSKKYTRHLVSINIVSFIAIIILLIFISYFKGSFVQYSLLLIAFSIIAIFMLYPTYLLSKKNTVKIDKRYFYFYNRDELKNKIPLQNIRKVTYEIQPGYRYLYPFWSNLYFLIYYQEDREMKTLYIGFHLFNDDDVIRIYYALRRRLKVKNVRRYIFP
jgi:hypothetical protein